MHKTVSLLPFQQDVLTSKEKFVWACWGLGTGKTWTLAHYAINRMLTNPETLGLIGAPQWTTVRDTILPQLTRELDLLGLKYDYNSYTNMFTLHTTGAQVKMFSMENYEMLRGIEIGWFCLEEACLCKEAAYKILLGRLRCNKSRALEGRCFSTPRGYDHMYDRYVGDRKNNKHKLVHATSFDNPHLPDGYIEDMIAGYSPKEVKQEVMAEFVSTAEGNVYHAFDRAEHVRTTRQLDGYPIYVGMDFNVNPMTAVLANVTMGCVMVFDEIYLKNANTFMMRDEIRSRYPHDRIIVVPDASGSARKTSSSQSDHEILREAGFEVQTTRRNPAIEDRYNTVNGRLTEGRIQIDPKCTMTQRDLERVTHEANPSYLTHISDALGYLAWKIFPVKKPRPKSRVRHL
jgi:phage terminase large subunit